MSLSTTVSHQKLLLVAAANVTALIFVGWWRKCRRLTAVADKHQQLRDKVPPKTITEFESAAQDLLDPLSKVYFQYFSDPATTLSGCRQFLD